MRRALFQEATHSFDLPIQFNQSWRQGTETMSSYLLACLPALTPNCLIQNFDRHDYLSGEDDDFQNEKQPPREVFAHEVCFSSTLAVHS